MHSAVPQQLREPWAMSGVPLQGIPMRLQQARRTGTGGAAGDHAGETAARNCCGARNSTLEAGLQALVGANMSLQAQDDGFVPVLGAARPSSTRLRAPGSTLLLPPEADLLQPAAGPIPVPTL
ncbi:hypothetical protein TGAM01_v209771 [Trichoderma gamsii]|uniref:Uncharacterized protein n=1 Tax=Trichoderma gamsii TaxID=398673 RepID=A0A2P4ZAJ4_9HYPO|nr:hypothetical protein TGAM01_v209771 [Trichoderma gamsii]PON21320.1 hypothetical protein TGAM01_v209771 [Trichoderma gamsii]